MSTLTPRLPYSLEELHKLYPQSLELQQVQILLRHGERTPVSARFHNAGLPPHWPYCKAATSLRAAILDADGQIDHLGWRRRLEEFGKNDVPTICAGPKKELEAICQPGELTDRGRETTLALGERTRKLYVEQLSFLPSDLDAGSIFLRSTPIIRALESVQQVFHGLYPPATREPGVPLPVIVTRAVQDETLFPNETWCKRFKELARAFAGRAATVYNDGPEMAYINKKIGRWMPKDSPEVKVDSHPRLSGVMDTINATRAHGPATKLPGEFYDAKLLEHIDRIAVEEWFAGFTESTQYRKLGVGAAVGDITQRMVEHVNATKSGPTSGSPFKMSLSGCHDTTIAGTLASLGAFDIEKDKWPNFTSSIAFELFKRKSDAIEPPRGPTGVIRPSIDTTWWSSLFSFFQTPTQTSARAPLSQLSTSDKADLDNYYVRLRYNDRPLQIPFCRQPGRHLEGDENFCTLAAFKEATDSFTPENWKAECGSNLGQPTMKPEIERPPGL